MADKKFQILYTRLSPRHNWDLLTTHAEKPVVFFRSWNGILKDSCWNGWLTRHPKAQIGLIDSDFDGGCISEIDNLKFNHPMLKVWDISELVSPIQIEKVG